MKVRFLQVSFFISAVYLILVAYSGGPAAQGIDRTGSPVAGGSTCSDCHGAANANTILSIRMLDGSNNPVSTYTPGQVYTLEIQVSNSSFTLFGAQAVVLNAGNTNAGTLNTTPLTANTQVTVLNGRSYLEHDSRSSTGLFKTQWTAPSAGAGTLTVYAMGNAVNGAGTAGDQPSSPGTLTLTEAVATTIAYGQSTYCNDATDPTPTITGVTPGSFSASPSGLSINGNSGAIDLSASTPGSYTITYTYGGGTTTSSVTVVARDVATITYGTNPSYCNNAQTAGIPVITGTGSGTFSATPAGLSISPTSGTVDPTQSTPGNYTVSYTTSGVCPTTATAPITIVQGDNASFTYGGGSFCQTGTDPTPTIAGTSGGGFTATPAGLSINASTGTIDVSASTVASYQVTYTTTGTCPTSTTMPITISAAGSAAFNYSATSFCSDATDPSATITGIGGGTFSAASGLSINSGTGLIDLSASTAGSYTVYYNVTGACPANDSTMLTILTADQATMSYALSTYCNSDVDPSPTIGGTTGGSFSASPSGLSINATSGLIDLDASTADTYTISYITTGSCPDTAMTTLTVDACSGLNNTLQSGISLYPNPTVDGSFFLKNGGDAMETELRIYNSLGQLLSKEIFYLEANTSRQSSLPSNLPKGFYMIETRQGNKVQTFRLLHK